MHTSNKRSLTETFPILDVGDSKRLAVDQTQVQIAGSPTHQLRFQQREYHFGELSLVVKCRALPSIHFDDYVASGEDSSGLDIWEAASAVCDFLVKYLSAFQDLPGIRVIELGAGAGLPSLVAAKLGCNVTLTDFDPNALELARENVKLNFLENWCSVSSLDVQADLAKDSQLTEEGYDVVCAADILYASMMARPTVSMVARLLKPNGVLLIAHQPRFTITLDHNEGRAVMEEIDTPWAEFLKVCSEFKFQHKKLGEYIGNEPSGILLFAISRDKDRLQTMSAENM